MFARRLCVGGVLRTGTVRASGTGGEPCRGFWDEPEDGDAEQSGNTADGEYPAPRFWRDVPVTGELREDEDAKVDARAHDSSNDGARNFGPTFGDEGNAVGPDATDAEADEEAKDEHLFKALCEVAEAAEGRVEQYAEAERAGAANFVAEGTHPDAADGCTKEQAGV